MVTDTVGNLPAGSRIQLPAGTPIKRGPYRGNYIQPRSL